MTRATAHMSDENWPRYAAPCVDPTLWTAVVPAAGKGSRLGCCGPKILFPVAGRPILEWLLDLLLPCCSELVFVLSPQGRPAVERELQRFGQGRFRVAVQPVPIGMGDAVEVGLAEVHTPHLLVIWGDQVAVHKSSIDLVLRLHQGRLQPDITCPTVLRRDAYIHFERDPYGRIRRVLQAREGDAMPAQGESDTGVFCFRTSFLRDLFRRWHEHPQVTGARTRELNLLPLISLAAQSSGTVLTPHVMSVEETIGINCPTDALAVEEFLSRRSHV